MHPQMPSSHQLNRGLNHPPQYNHDDNDLQDVDRNNSLSTHETLDVIIPCTTTVVPLTDIDEVDEESEKLPDKKSSQHVSQPTVKVSSLGMSFQSELTPLTQVTFAPTTKDPRQGILRPTDRQPRNIVTPTSPTNVITSPSGKRIAVYRFLSTSKMSHSLIFMSTSAAAVLLLLEYTTRVSLTLLSRHPMSVIVSSMLRHSQLHCYVRSHVHFYHESSSFYG